MKREINMYKLIHCADIHLDTPFHSKSSEQASAGRRELRRAFLSVIECIKKEGIAVALLAGDIFDSAYASADTVAFFKDAVASAPDCTFVISPGNHDPYTEDGVYGGEFPANVHIFVSNELSYIDVPNTDIRVYGYAFTSPSLDICPFISKKPEDREKINILCAHADIGNPLSVYCPVSVNDIAGSGFDYCAFGHIHLNDGVKSAEGVPYAYSGCLSGRDFGETGPKGAIIASIDSDKKPTFESRIFSRYDYEERTLDVTGVCDGSELRSRINNVIDGLKSEIFLRLELVGTVPMTLTVDTSALEDEMSDKVFYIEIEDSTLPLFDAEQLKNDPTIMGAFFSELLPMLENGSASERRIAAKALKVGISALRGEELPE